MKKITLNFLFLALIGIALNGCKKETAEDLDPQSATNTPALALNNSPSIHDYVQYNAAHDVLVFDSFEDLGKLGDLLQTQVQNYPFNRGNEALIANDMQRIEQNGYTTNPSGQGNQVNLGSFQQLLIASHPLSSGVLEELLMLHDLAGFPPSFMTTIFLGNLPFGYDTRQGIQAANLPQQVKQQILNADDAELDVPNYAYLDFLANFPQFNSLYTSLLNKELQDLANGVDPGSQGFDDDLVTLESERLLYNDKHEIYVEGHLFKLYEDCKSIAFQNAIEDAYDDLQRIDPGGNPTIPQLEEDPSGIDASVMNDHIPAAYISYNPEVYDPLGDTDNDPNYNTTFQEYNIVENCPKSNFSYMTDVDGIERRYEFINMTDISALPVGETYYHYWQFGDGTGSFEDNPIHDFPSEGVYHVSLTSFSKDCGCWHVSRIPITISRKTREYINPDCPIGEPFVSYTGPLEDDQARIDISVGEPAVEGTFVTNHIFRIYEENPDEIPSAEHIEEVDREEFSDWVYDVPSNDYYWVVVTVFWSDGCYSISKAKPIHIAETPESPYCCDKKDKDKEKDWTEHVGSSHFKLKVKNIARGSFGTSSYRKIAGKQKMYREKSGGGWKKFKVHHKVDVSGNYWDRHVVDGADVCIDVHSHARFYRSGDEYSSFEYEKRGFAERFGLKENSITFEHTTYLGGDMVPQASGPSINVGGIIVFDKEEMSLGVCE